GGVSLQPVPVLQYLGLYFERTLTFCPVHTCAYFYGLRAASTVQAMLMLGNSVKGLPLKQRRILYQPCILLLMTFGC
ncbi:hypothetical protein GY45DRAFT_1209748, partial [Cubamyces sp. BRFM 1775]